MSEGFRNDLLSRLFGVLPQDEIQSVLQVIDTTLQDYDVHRKPVSLIVPGEIPEVVKFFLASKAVSNASPGTLKIYKLRLIDFFSVAKKAFQDITANDIRMYLYCCKNSRGASDSYLDNIRRILNSFFGWLVDNEYLVRNPCAKVEHIKYQQHERKPLSSYDLEVLRWHCKTLREKAMIDLFFSSGIRLSEFHDLNKSDICWTDRSIVIRHGKGNKRRTVFFNAEAELSLRLYLNSRSDDNEALFVTIRAPHNRMGQKSIQNEINHIATRAGLHVHPHILRHTFATSGLRGGMPLETLQALIGHSEPKTTLIYAKLDNIDLQRAHSRIYA